MHPPRRWLAFASLALLPPSACSDAFDGFCDDGGPGADFSLCGFGTDCTDCGSR